MNIPWIPIVVVVGVIAVVGVIGYLIIQANKTPVDNGAAQAIENDATTKLPGEFVDLPTVWKEGTTLAHYGASNGPNTNAHVTGNVDYSGEKTANSSTGLPPVGGPHWGAGGCPETVAQAQAYCGPVPWGIYREPNEWPAESLVHNMEHGGVVVWYNSDDTAVRDKLEQWVKDVGKAKNKFTVLTPYKGIPASSIAMTSWTRRDVFPVSDLTESRVKDFINKLACRFNPEGFDCGKF